MNTDEDLAISNAKFTVFVQKCYQITKNEKNYLATNKTYIQELCGLYTVQRLLKFHLYSLERHRCFKGLMRLTKVIYIVYTNIPPKGLDS